jgi:hypothetical protein
VLALLLSAVLVPSSADSVLSVEDSSGLRALLAKAGTYAPSLTPDAVGAVLYERVGVDLLAESAAWGLAPRGARMLVLSRRATGLSAPLRDPGAAKKALASWIAQDRRRVGRIAGSRLLTASGRDAAALVKSMARPTALPRDLAPHAKGPVWLWTRMAAPLRAAVLSIEASGLGILARGIVTADGPVLAGRAPAGCDGGIGCLRAGLGPSGQAALARVLEQLGHLQPGLQTAARVEERLEGLDVRALADPRSLPRALRISAVFDGPEAGTPALEGRLDLAAIEAALTAMTPLDALRGGLAAGVYAAHLVYGPLLRNAGPLTVTGNPQRAAAASIELRLPLR